MAFHVRGLAERVVYTLVPRVDNRPPIFHDWSNRHLQPRFRSLGFDSPEDFFAKRVVERGRAQGGLPLRIVGLGSGRCELAITLALALGAAGIERCTITCVDMNGAVLREAARAAADHGLGETLRFALGDLNRWRAHSAYGIVIVNPSLHHVLQLETLLDEIAAAIGPDGVLLLSDVIGRDGHRFWPEAQAEMQRFFAGLPSRRRYDRALGRVAETLVDYDHAGIAFEGIRCQDILPLLIERFAFPIVAPHSCIVLPFVERRFGWNFNPESAADRTLIDRIDAEDQRLLASGAVKPTQLLAELVVGGAATPSQRIAPWAEPIAGVRAP